jgi:hypothetical protein
MSEGKDMARKRRPSGLFSSNPEPPSVDRLTPGTMQGCSDHPCPKAMMAMMSVFDGFEPYPIRKFAGHKLAKR